MANLLLILLLVGIIAAFRALPLMGDLKHVS
jgi:hypothetical protein